MIVYVVAFETIGSMGGHDWFYDPAHADACYKDEVEAKNYETIVRFKADVPEGLSIDEITDLIDAHAWQHTLTELHETTQEVAV